MAEVIEEMQERLLPEYEQMKRFEVFTEAQIKDIMEKRLKHQTRITKSAKTIRDYLDFIIYERKVHRLITEKEIAGRTKLMGLKSSIVKRIIKLYREALSAFPHEEKLWQNFLQFSKKSVAHEVAGIYEKMLTLHSDKPQYWAEYAIWCYFQTGKIDKPKSILYRALDHHPKAEILHKSLFDLLLKAALSMSSKRDLEDNTMSESEFGLQYLQIAYEHSKRHIDNLEYFLSVLERCQENDKVYDLTINIQKKILDDLMEKYSANPKLWDTLAQRELNGFHMNDLINNNSVETEIKENSKNKMKRFNAYPLKERLELCYKIYIDAVKNLKNTEMYEYFINAMLNLNSDTSPYRQLSREYLMTAMEMAVDSELISDEQLKIYGKILLKSEKTRESMAAIFERLASKRNSIKFYLFWLESIPVYCHGDNERTQEIAFKMFKQAEENLNSDDLIELVSLIINFFDSLNINNKSHKCFVEEIYADICSKPVPGFGIFRAEYLERCYQNTNSINLVRKKFEEFTRLPAPSVELYKKMAEIEISQAPPNIEKCRACYYSATLLFGESDPDLWLDFMRLERDHGTPKHITLLYARAKSRLKTDHLENFVNKVALLFTLQMYSGIPQ